LVRVGFGLVSGKKLRVFMSSGDRLVEMEEQINTVGMESVLWLRLIFHGLPIRENLNRYRRLARLLLDANPIVDVSIKRLACGLRVGLPFVCWLKIVVEIIFLTCWILMGESV